MPNPKFHEEDTPESRAEFENWKKRAERNRELGLSEPPIPAQEPDEESAYLNKENQK